MIIMLMKYMVVKVMVMVVYNGVDIVTVTVATTMIIMMMTHMMVKMMVMVVDR